MVSNSGGLVMMDRASSNQATKQTSNQSTKQPSIRSFRSPRHLAVLVLMAIQFQAEELDSKVRELWTRLSSKDDTFSQIHDTQQLLQVSVMKLKQDLDHSIVQNNTFHNNVSIAKRLFL